MTPVFYTAKAKRQLRRIWEYWDERVSMDVANGQVRKVWQGIALLAQQPTAGKPVPQYGEGLCVVTAGKYLLYYHRRKGAVWIVQILAGERDQRRAFSSVKG